MKTEIRRVGPLLSLLGLSAAAGAAHAEASANVTLISDYLFRGITQTDHQAALQGGIDWSGSSGLYASLWLSDTDFNPPGEETSGVEVDLIAGYVHELGESSLDVGFISYQYPNIDANLEEVYLGFSTGNLSAKVYYDWDNETTYLESGYEWTVGEDVTLGIAGGWFEADGGADYIHYGFSVGKSVGGFDWSLGVSDTDIDGDDVTALVGISRSFDLF